MSAPIAWSLRRGRFRVAEGPVSAYVDSSKPYAAARRADAHGGDVAPVDPGDVDRDLEREIEGKERAGVPREAARKERVDADEHAGERGVKAVAAQACGADDDEPADGRSYPEQMEGCHEIRRC